MLMVAHACLTASAYLVAVLLGRGLGPAGYGVYGIVYSVLLGVELIGRLGVPQAASKLIAEQEEGARRLEATSITLTATLYLSIFAIFWLMAPQLARLFRVEDGDALFRLASYDIPFYGLYFICSHILNGRRNFASESLGLIVYSMSRVVGISILFFTGLSVPGALWVNIGASLLGLAFVATRVGKASFRPTLECYRPILGLAVPIGLFAVGSQGLLSMDLWILNALGTDVSSDEKGLYVAALNLARMPNVTAFVASAVMIPSIARACAQNLTDVARETVRNGVRVLLILILPICGLIAAQAENIMKLVFSDFYGDGARFLAVLVLAHGLFYTTFMVFCGVLIAAGGARQAAVLSLSTLPVSAVLCAILVATHGAEGATWAALGVTFAAAFVAGVLVSREMHSTFELSVLVRVLLVSAAVSAAARALPWQGWTLVVGMGGLFVLYLLALPLFGLLRRQDVEPFLPSRKRQI